MVEPLPVSPWLCAEEAAAVVLLAVLPDAAPLSKAVELAVLPDAAPLLVLVVSIVCVWPLPSPE